MSAHYRPETIAVLRYIVNNGGASISDIEAVLTHIPNVRRVAINLQTHGHVAREHRGHENLGALYVATPRGSLLIRSMAKPPAPGGEMPAPRSCFSSEPYIPQSIVTRPGSQDFLSLPSLRGQERVPHRLPISMAGGGE